MYAIDSDDEDIVFVSRQTPSIVRKINPPPMNEEEINISSVTDKIPSERDFTTNSAILEEEHP